MSNTQPECNGCQHHVRCTDVYRRLGSSNTAPVAGKVVLAFVVPLALCILILAASGQMLSGIVQSNVAGVIGIALAALGILVYALAVKRWMVGRSEKR